MDQKEFMAYIIDDLLRHNVDVVLKHENPDKAYAGSYKHSPPRRVFISYSDEDFIETLCHEYGHFLQHQNRPSFYRKHGHCSFNLWLHNQKANCSEKNVLDWLRDSIILEHDCEKIATNLFKSFEVEGVDLEDYIRKANCYIFSFWYAFEFRKMPKNVWAPYDFADSSIKYRSYYLNRANYEKKYREHFINEK